MFDKLIVYEKISVNMQGKKEPARFLPFPKNSICFFIIKDSNYPTYESLTPMTIDLGFFEMVMSGGHAKDVYEKIYN